MLARKRPTIQEFVAVNDTFGESATPAELMKKYNIDAEAVKNAVKKIMAR
jgi:transketolase